MSNNQMISVPEGFMLVERDIWTEQQVDSAAACITLLKDVPGMTDRDLAMAAIDAAQCKAPDITLADILPAEQHQGEPVAFYREFVDGREYCEKPFTNDWTPLYTHPAPVQQGEPVYQFSANTPSPAWFDISKESFDEYTKRGGEWLTRIVYTHTDAGEVEQGYHNSVVEGLVNRQNELREERDTLRAQLAERDVLLREWRHGHHHTLRSCASILRRTDAALERKPQQENICTPPDEPPSTAEDCRNKILFI
jgi:hypothetical protein